MNSSRLLAQYFKSWRSAGVRMCPPCEISDLTAAAGPAATGQNTAEGRRGSRQGLAAPARSETIRSSSRGSETGGSSSTAPAPETGATGKTPEPATVQPVAAGPLPDGTQMSRQKKVHELQIIADRVAACTRCEELATTRTQTVFGVGNPDARILFLGEAPGADEDRQGEPFVGRAGKLLNDIIKASQLKREDLYICNVLRCRPPGNRNPSDQEAANCREYLDQQIAIVAPEFIVCWGSVAAHKLLDLKVPIGKLRQQFFEYGQARVLCTYHPSYLLRNPSAKKFVWEDMKFLMRELGVTL